MSDDVPVCKVCGFEKEWVDCFNCEDGYWDETEIDPLDGDEFCPCSTCGAKGGWYECPNVEQHFKESQRLTP